VSWSQSLSLPEYEKLAGGSGENSRLTEQLIESTRQLHNLQHCVLSAELRPERLAVLFVCL